MAAVAVGVHLHDVRAFAGADVGRYLVARLLHREHVHAVDGNAGDTERLAAAEKLGGRRSPLQRRAHGIAVVLDNVDDRQLPQAGHVEGLVDLALVGGAVAEVAEVEAAVAAVLVGEGEPGAERHRSADDAVSAVEFLLDGEHVHRAALALGIAADAPGQLGHHALRFHPRRQHVAVVAVGGDHRILVGGTRVQAGDHGLLTDVEVAEAGDQSHAVKLAGLLLEATDQQHFTVELQQLLRVRLGFGLRLGFAAALGGCFRWHLRSPPVGYVLAGERRPGETHGGGEYIVAACYCGQL